MSDREQILGDIRAALASTDSAPVQIPRDYDRADDIAGSPDVLELFVARLNGYGARVHRVTLQDASDAVADALHGRDARRVVVPGGLDETWLASSGFDWVRDSPPLSVDELDRVDAVLTGAAVAIADSGTIVLDGGSGQGRRALSLVPDAMVMVVRGDQVVADLTAAIARLDGTRPMTFVSGPSATVDIELVRVAGVHGPRDLDVVLLDGMSEDSPGG